MDFKYWSDCYSTAIFRSSFPETLSSEELINCGFEDISYRITENPNTPQYIVNYLKLREFITCYE